MKKVLIAILCFVLAILVAAASLLIYGDLYAKNYKYYAPEQIDLEANKLNTITAVGRGLYDESGKRFDIKGTNFGNLFIFEGWMTVNSLGALTEGNSYSDLNDDGRYVEGYEEIFQEEMDAVLANRFTDEQIETLNDAYFESYCTEADFEIIKELHKSGTTILLVEQNASKALEIADRAYVLETGSITLSGTGRELANSDEVRKAYLGG